MRFLLSEVYAYDGMDRLTTGGYGYDVIGNQSAAPGGVNYTYVALSGSLGGYTIPTSPRSGMGLDSGKNQLVLDAIGPFKPSNAVFAVKIIFKYLRLELQRILHSLPLFLSVLHSIPPFVSTCRGSVQALTFVLSREPTIEEQLAGIEPKSPFERACEMLGIEVIAANLPQAKGRVERSHGVYQDRLVKELRMAQISTIEGANCYLREVYLPKINEKFAKTPLRLEDAHVPLTTPTSLEDILCYETPRVVSNNYVVSYKRRLLQITHTARVLPKPKTQVIVRELLDGRIKLLYQNTELAYIELGTILHKEELATRSA